jgi:hypothetical protein
MSCTNFITIHSDLLIKRPGFPLLLSCKLRSVRMLLSGYDEKQKVSKVEDTQKPAVT